MSDTTYPTIIDNEWVTPVPIDYTLICCNCGSTHAMDFRINKSKQIQFRARKK